jgi:hypothetical protein
MSQLFFKIRNFSPPLQTSPEYINTNSDLGVFSDLNKIKEKNRISVYNNRPIYVNQLNTNLVGRVNIKPEGCKSCGMK